jgi:hypothetical protein
MRRKSEPATTSKIAALPADDLRRALALTHADRPTAQHIGLVVFAIKLDILAVVKTIMSSVFHRLHLRSLEPRCS